MKIKCEVCKQEGYLQQLGNYFRIRHYEGKGANGKGKFYYHQQTPAYVKSQLPESEFCSAEKTLTKVGEYGCGKTGQESVQKENEHLTSLKTGLEQENKSVRDSPSLVWGRPAKSVVERPRGFKSHIPRHF